ncbi:MAG: hypothetical protein KatS3mg023_3790 [Armatimonadota bacterium]|nr:MAG: hypothetical protein KatS3mg023_3790 [Armatimonadota bacterium]
MTRIAEGAGQLEGMPPCGAASCRIGRPQGAAAERP